MQPLEIRFADWSCIERPLDDRPYGVRWNRARILQSVPLNQDPAGERVGLDARCPRLFAESNFDRRSEARTGFERGNTPSLAARDIGYKGEFRRNSSGELH